MINTTAWINMVSRKGQVITKYEHTRVCNSFYHEITWSETHDAMQTIYPRVSWSYTTWQSVYLHYPCFSVYPAWLRSFASSLCRHTRAVAQSISVSPATFSTHHRSVLCEAEWQCWWEKDFLAKLMIETKIWLTLTNIDISLGIQVWEHFLLTRRMHHRYSEKLASTIDNSITNITTPNK